MHWEGIAIVFLFFTLIGVYIKYEHEIWLLRAEIEELTRLLKEEQKKKSPYDN